MSRITNPSLAFGYSSPDYPAGWEVNTFSTAAAVSASYVVALTTNGQVRHAAATVGGTPVVGVALDGATSGKTVRVACRGPVRVVKDNSNFAVGDAVRLSATTDGIVALLGPTTAVTQAKDLRLTLGVVLSAATTGASTVDVFLV